MPQKVTDQTLEHWIDVARSGGFKNSMNYFPGDGVRLDFDINFAGGYIKKEDVKVYQVNPVTGARFEVEIVSVNGNTVRVDRVTPVGRNLVIFRDTDKRFPLVDFQDNSIVNERNLDLNAKQAIFAVAEMVDRFDDSVTFAAEAAGAVEEAKAAQAKAEAAALVSATARDESVSASAQAVTASTAATVAAQQTAIDAVTASASSATAIAAAQEAKSAEATVVPLVPVVDKASKDAAAASVKAEEASKRAEQAVVDVKSLGAVPIGAVLLFVKEPLPAGYLALRGGKFDKLTYPDLFTLLGTDVLPDFTDRTPKMTGTDLALLEKKGWVWPQHAHTFSASGTGSGTTTAAGGHTHGVNDPGHTHTVAGAANRQAQSGSASNVASVSTQTTSSSGTGISIAATGDHTHNLSVNVDVSGTTSSAGTGSTVEVDRIGVVYAIKAAGVLSNEGMAQLDGVIAKNVQQDSDIAAVRTLALEAKRPLFSVEWWGGKRTAIPAGGVPSDGQLLPRNLYPDVVAAIVAGVVPVVTDAEWLADPTKRGCYTLGDGSTNFRVPDYNGKHVDSLGAVFMRGDGKNSHASGAGYIQSDTLQDHDHKLPGGSYEGNYNFTTPAYPTFGSNFGGFVQNYSTRTARDSHYGATPAVSDATNHLVAARTASETRPVAATGCWIIWLFGAVTNAGAADAAALATAYAQLASRMSVLEQRKSTCLVNAVGTGAPHETVDAALPANVTTNSRYVLTNPFGINTPVQVVAEVMYNGAWADSGWLYAQSVDSGYGVRAMYKQGEGIIVQTGKASVLARANIAGGGHGGVTSDTNGALPCRVFVRKMEA